MNRVRAFFFYLGVAVVTISVVVLLPLMVLVPFRWRRAFVGLWPAVVLWWLKVTCGIDYRVEGRQHIPARPAVVLAKHQSAWETIAFQLIFPTQTWVLKRELLWIPLFGWGLAATRPIAIDRKAGKKALRQVVEQGTERLREGLWVVVFPEGTRVPPGEKGRYAQGGATLAVKAGVPIVPVAHNAGSFWPKQGFCKWPGTIAVRIGPVIEPNGRSAAEVTREAEAWIEAQMPFLEGAAGAPQSAPPEKVTS